MENNHPVKKFTIDRAKWGKGQLHNEDGSMCCLGFYAKACGVSEEEMGSKGYPYSLSESCRAKLPEWATDRMSDDIQRLVNFNDESRGKWNMVRRCRADVEKYIAKTFAKHGVKVTFKGKKS